MPAATISPISVPDTLQRHDLTTMAGTPGIPDPGLLGVLSRVPDPRDPRGLRYLMGLLLAIAVLATTACMRGFPGYATWARTAPADLHTDLGLAKSYRPSDKTFRRVLGLIDPADLDRRLGGYFTTVTVAATDTTLLAVVIDGKTLRLACRMGATAAHPVSAFTHHAHLVIGQLAVSDTTSETPAV
ncbi:transposase family protein [Nocardia sp. R7R-8]|uniref:transposase family protein n=1 Tax=Nocardia sp. R7R-8 TaxID=3459304 RepID=UPI00403D8B96